MHEVLLPAHPADRLGSKDAALDAIVAVFEVLVSDVLETLDDADAAAYRVKRALDNDEEPDAEDVAVVLEAYETAESEISELESRLEEEALEATAPKVAAVLSKMEHERALFLDIEDGLLRGDQDGVKAAFARLTEWRKEQSAEEEKSP
jgi:hypothetical protein